MFGDHKVVKSKYLDSDMFLYAYRMMIFIPVLMLGYSCEKLKESTIPPSLAIYSDSINVEDSTVVSPGAIMNFEIHAYEGSEKLTNFYIEIRGSASKPVRYYDTALYTSQFIWQGSFYKSPDPAEEWNFVVRDRRGGNIEKSVLIIADTISSYNPVYEIEDLYLGAQNNSIMGGFYSFQKDERYSTLMAKENQQWIDLVYYYGEDNQTIASPGANIDDGIYPSDLHPKYWEIRNTTKYLPVQISESEFNNIVNDSAIIANYNDTDAKRKAKFLEDGDVFTFKNQHNRYGILRVVEVDDTDTGSILVDLKLQIIE